MVKKTSKRFFLLVTHELVTHEVLRTSFKTTNEVSDNFTGRNEGKWTNISFRLQNVLKITISSNFFHLSASENIWFQFLDWEEFLPFKNSAFLQTWGVEIKEERKIWLLIFPLLSNSAQNKRSFNSLNSWLILHIF